MKKSVFLLFCCLTVMALFIRTGLLSNLPPEVVLLKNKTVGPGDFLCRDATVSITTAGGSTSLIVEGGGGLDLVSGQVISLMPGTHIRQGGTFGARITTTANYCDPMKDGFAVSDLIRDVKTYNPAASAARPERLAHMGQGALRVYPNPASTVIHIDFMPPDDQVPVHMMLLGVRGEVVLSATMPAGQQHHSMNLRGQPGGIYFLRVVAGTQAETVRILKTDHGAQ